MKDVQPEFTKFTVSLTHDGSYYIVINKLEDIIFHRAPLIIGTNYPMKLSTHQVYFYLKLFYLSNLIYGSE